MWKAHGIWIAYWRLWNDSSHSGCVWRMKIINYKSPSYLIPLERELEASVVILPSSVFHSPSMSVVFLSVAPIFTPPHPSGCFFFASFSSAPSYYFFFSVSLQTHFYLLILSCELPFIFYCFFNAIRLSFHVLRSPVWMDSRVWARRSGLSRTQR